MSPTKSSPFDPVASDLEGYDISVNNVTEAYEKEA